MIKNFFKTMFGTRNQRLIKQYSSIVATINALQEEYSQLSDQDLVAKTDQFRARLQEGESIDSILPEAFAAVREASWRTLKMRHFDVQLIGGLALHYGKVIEMRTGEGKTLSATLPGYLNALSGKGVHVVTVNDYLAERDANWMRPVYEFLGMTVGINPSALDSELKKQAYAADIIYGTNNEFGFDYLRDNMVYDLDQQVQRSLHYAILDEVDSILIDEARTPLIISGQTEESSQLYQEVNKLIPLLTLQEKSEEDGKNKSEDEPEPTGDYTLDEKSRQAYLTETGHQKVENLLRKAGLLKEETNLYDAANISLLHYFNASLRAHTLYNRDVDYIVKDGQVVIVDEHTGRLMEGRRWSDGLHQAVEAKEGVTVETENQTLATITFQNYFRLYEKLSGMTGTADTEAFELQKIYNLEVLVIPTNRPTIREDHADKMFLNMRGKYKAIVEELQSRNEKEQPVLVGTASIEASEHLSDILREKKIKHEVLNAKNHGREARIIAQAGRPSAITIATNMAGRGTDIVLGGNFQEELDERNEQNEEKDKPPLTAEEEASLRKQWQEAQEKVKAAGGLHVLGTERNESRRVDNQLRGRSGRQGDPGSSQFYLSLDDNLLRIFAADRMASLFKRLGVGEDDAIQHSMTTRSIENAQRRVEGMNFDMRKQLLQYDDVANDQRKVIYQQRHKLLLEKDVSEAIAGLRMQVAEDLVALYMPPDSVVEQWDIPELETRLAADFDIKINLQDMLAEDQELGPEEITAKIRELIQEKAVEKEETCDLDQLREIERQTLLQLLDQHWKDHLAAMDHLRQSIHLRGYAQKNPAQEYKRECFDMFTDMLDRIKYDLVSTISKVQVVPHPDQENEALAASQIPLSNIVYSHQEMTNLPDQLAQAESGQGALDADASEVEQKVSPSTVVRNGRKVGRNDSCPCGSGKKYKHCHGLVKE